MDFLRPYQKSAQINDWHHMPVICEESENNAFRFRRAKSAVWTFYDPVTAPPFGAPESMTWEVKSLIREESGNDDFHFPLSKKPIMDFLRPY